MFEAGLGTSASSATESSLPTSALYGLELDLAPDLRVGPGYMGVRC